jgi:hypothetical protein
VTNGAMLLLLRLVEKLLVLSPHSLKVNTLLCSIVTLCKDGSSLLKLLSMLLLLIMEVNQSLLLLLTKRLLMMSLKTPLFFKFVVNLLKQWLFHMRESWINMVDTSVTHLQLSHLLQLSLLKTLQQMQLRP